MFLVSAENGAGVNKMTYIMYAPTHSDLFLLEVSSKRPVHIRHSYNKDMQPPERCITAKNAELCFSFKAGAADIRWSAGALGWPPALCKNFDELSEIHNSVH